MVDALLLKRRSRRDRMKAKLKEVAGELRQRMHQSIPAQGTWLKQVVTGYFAYHAVPTNWEALGAFRDGITRRWWWTLRRRSQKSALNWTRMKQLAHVYQRATGSRSHKSFTPGPISVSPS